MNRNSPKLLTSEGRVSNFRVHEFANREGLAMVNIDTLDALQNTREALHMTRGDVVRIIITNATRTLEDNKVLARDYGWINNGGKVSNNSQHLVSNGANGVDFIAIDSMGEPVPTKVVAAIAKRYFKFVKAYKDGHVHGDMRKKNEGKEIT